MGNSFRNNSFYKFVNYRLDPVERTLWRDDKLVQLPAKVFDTLLVLVESDGKVVTKAEILDTVWKDLFVEEGNLTQNIYTLRRIFAADENGDQFIETLPKKGYRFACPVEVVESMPAVGEVEPAARIADEPEITKTAQPVRRRRRAIAAAAAIALIATSAIGGGYYFLRYRRAETATLTAKQATFQKLNFSGDIEFPVISPSGDAFAYVSDRRLYLQQGVTEPPVTVEITGLKDIGSLQFTRDGMSIAYRDRSELFASADIYRVSIIGGVPGKIAENVWGGFSYSPNGAQLAFVRHFPESNRQQLIIKDLQGGTEKVLKELESPFRFAYGGYPSWSSDSSKIALPISEQAIQIPSTQLAVFSTSSGEMQELKMPQFRHIAQAAWMPDGNSLLMVAREARKTLQIWRAEYPSGATHKISNDGNVYRTLTLSSDGKTAMTGQFTTVSHIWTADAADPTNAKQITKGNLNRDGVIGFAMTPDDRLIFTSRNGGVVDLWEMGLNGEDRRQLTKNAGDQNARPAASNDGKFVYFTSIRSGKNQIWRMNAGTGEEQTQITSNDEETAQFPQISPDGKVLYYIKKAAKDKNRIWRRFLDDGREEMLPISGEITPENFLALSPDGKFLATCDLTEVDIDEDEERVYRIAMIPTESPDPPRIFSSPSGRIYWNPDSRSFDYVGNSGRNVTIWRQSFDAMPESVLELKDTRLANFAWTKNQRTFVFAKRRISTDAILLTELD